LHAGGRRFDPVWLHQFSVDSYLMNIDPSFIALLRSGELIPSNTENQNSLTSLGLTFRLAESKLQVTPPLELFDKKALLAELPESVTLDIFGMIGSTNAYLMEKIGRDDFFESICLSEYQSAGRGRRGRKWISPFGRNIYLSLAWQVPRDIGINGLSLVVGMQVVKSLRDAGLVNAGLKWPNDVLLDGGKLAGILIEVGAPKGNFLPLVVGVGINLAMDELVAKEIDQKWSHAGEMLSVSRNEMVIRLIANLRAELELFSRSGFEPYQEVWKSFNAYQGKAVKVIMGDKFIEGTDLGVDEKGCLILKTSAGTKVFNAGEVSLRQVEAK
jgi:BirA family biotin operon repressor/biotin-[acetyl-CoA-carboxylase] ligase